MVRSLKFMRSVLLLLLLGLAGPWGAVQLGGGQPGGSAWVWADDGSDDGGGDDGGDSSGSDAGDSGGGSGSDGGADAGSGGTWWEGWFAPSESFVPDELLALNPSPAALQRAREHVGARVLHTHTLPALDLRVVRLQLSGMDARTARDRLRQSDPGVFELNHWYANAQGAAVRPPAGSVVPCAGHLCDSKALLGWPRAGTQCGQAQAIGIVDTAVQTQHPVLRGAALRVRSWVPQGKAPAQDDHGTAVAALLVGQPGSEYPGLVPRARLYAASPFYVTPEGLVRADAWGLVQSLDWLLAQRVGVIGLSLAGDASVVLEAALARVQARGVLVAAAAGNGGRLARPAYPAALPSVLAVTAITAQSGSYRRANRGAYIEYAMPGTELMTVTAAGGVVQRSGTSYAVPFLVAMVSQTLAEGRMTAAQWRTAQGVELKDLGQPGRDEIFGWGLPRARVMCR